MLFTHGLSINHNGFIEKKYIKICTKIPILSEEKSIYDEPGMGNEPHPVGVKYLTGGLKQFYIVAKNYYPNTKACAIFRDFEKRIV